MALLHRHDARHDYFGCFLVCVHYRNLRLLPTLREHTYNVHLLVCAHIQCTIAGVDFSGDNITFTISPGDSGFVVQFRVFDDQIQENSEENFICLLHFSDNSKGAVIGRNAVRLVIEDNDSKLVKAFLIYYERSDETF